MSAAETAALLLRFGAFELDLKNNELRRNGVLIKLPPQPLQVLRQLAENAGEIQSRDQIQRTIWGAGTFVDFDRNLNVCMAQIRAALNDDADSPRFIQTIPRRGYRFVAPVERVVATSPLSNQARNYRSTAILVAVVGLAALTWAVLSIRHPRTASPNRITVAVLPFDNPEGAQERLSDGLVEELIGNLGSLHPERLGVIARSSVMRYAGAHRPIDQVGRELGVAYVIEGMVRRSDGRVRVSARLIKVADQAQVWNEMYEKDASDELELEQDAAARISAGVIRSLFPGVEVRNASIGTHSRQAYEAYRDGRYLEHNRGSLRSSIADFEKAVSFEPTFDEAYSAVADAHVALGRLGGPPAEAFPQARAAAEKALAIRETNAEAHNALANVMFWYEWNWKEAERHFTRAIEINPSFSPAHHDYAFFLVAMGRTEAAITSLRRAMALDPLSARVNVDAGWLLLQAHRFDQAIVQARRSLELEPGLAEADACVTRALLYQRKYQAVLEQLKQTPAGGDAEARLRSLFRAKLQEGGDPIMLAMRYAFLGEKSHALDALEIAYQRHSSMIPLLKTEPSFEPLHGEKRFQELARKVGLP